MSTIQVPASSPRTSLSSFASQLPSERSAGRSVLPAVPLTSGASLRQPDSPTARDAGLTTEIIVLKFGGSVLQEASDVDRVVDEVYRWVRLGHKVVCVVSALEGQTDALLDKARSFGDEPCPTSTALLLSTGELQSAALLGLALYKAGVHSAVVPVSAIKLRCLGDALDAELASVDTSTLRGLIDQHGVIIVPGFTGVGTHGQWHTLGRGGSDLTALFLACSLGASCRLIKDVDGLYEWDPQLPPQQAPEQRLPRRYHRVPIDRALSLGGQIVQDKALRFVRQQLQQFEVASLGSRRSTHVTSHEQEPLFGDWPGQHARTPLKVAILGLGTVGLGVASLIHSRALQFAITGILVRDLARGRHRGAAIGLDASIITTDWRQAIQEADIVIEALGGCEPAREILAEALLTGQHVVSANKALLAEHGQSLHDLASLRHVQLRYSASVGGAVPILETARRLQQAALAGGSELSSIAGILNGTTNFVLQRTLVQTGQTGSRAEAFAQAVKAAQELGFAEADPSRDLDGLDLADKLIVLAHHAWGLTLTPSCIEGQPLSPEGIDAALKKCPTGWTIRYIAELHLPRAAEHGQALTATIGLRPVPLDHPLANVPGAANAALFAVEGQLPVLVRGQGAGRWPTARAVLADVLDIAASLADA